MELNVSMSLAEFCSFDVHSDVLIYLRGTRAKDLPVRSGVYEQEFAIEDAIGALQKIVLPLQRVFE